MPPPPPPIPRRTFLRTSFCASAALALNQVPRPASAFDSTPDDVHLLLLGDFGSGKASQAEVAKSMQTFVTTAGLKLDSLLLLGDNFYRLAPFEDALSEARWKSGFEDMYPASVFNCPCPAVLGNHDYSDCVDGPTRQIAYTSTPGTRWFMPSKWFRRDIEGLATFLFLDTNLASLNSRGASFEGRSLRAEEQREQWLWLARELRKKRNPFTFVVGHHPVFSNGLHGDSLQLVQELLPLLQEGQVHWYLCGHDHDLQHIELEGLKTSFFISGGGGARQRGPGARYRPHEFFETSFGFSHVQINPRRTILRHINTAGEAVHTVEKTLDHRWRVLS